MPLLLADRWTEICTRCQDNYPPTSLYSSTLGPTQPWFEPLQSTNLRVLSFKSTLLLASVKRVGDLPALSINPACLEFGPNDSKVVLKPRLGYVPKVLSIPFRAQVIPLSAFSPSMSSQELHSHRLAQHRRRAIGTFL